MITEVENALNPIIEGLGFPVAWPNVSHKPTEDYLRVNHLGSDSESDTFGCDRLPSILQVDVITKEGSGTLISAPMVAAVIGALGKQSILSGGLKVEIYREPYVSKSSNVNGWFYTSISIPFEVYK